MFCTRNFLKDPSSRSGADHGSLEVLKPGYTQETKTWLVVLTPLKNMSSSVGIIIPNIWKVIKFMFQTTNQKHILL